MLPKNPIINSSGFIWISAIQDFGDYLEGLGLFVANEEEEFKEE